ncbi:MAG: hypothetical protein JZU47_15555 [Prolixibacteraceae bacterium]|nr:hypothetical protein [Prolixibacteraceae bacterium]
MRKIKREIVISSVLLICSLYSLGQIIPTGTYPTPPTNISTFNPDTETHYFNRINTFKADPLVGGDIVFLGNSITEFGGNWGIRFNSYIVKNRGISGDETQGVLQRLGEIYYSKPSKVFLLIGINDLWRNRTVQFVSQNILNIVDSITKYSPNSIIYVQTILPTTNQSLVSKIKQTNDILKDKQSFKNYTLIDLHPYFADINDMLKSNYTADGLHLNEQGYNLWVNFERKYVPELSLFNLIKNYDLKTTSDYWIMSGTPDMFKTSDWSPNPPARSFANNYWQWTDKSINGSIMQTISNLEDGEYVFSSKFIGGPAGNFSYSALVAIDGNNNQTKMEFKMPSSWTKIQFPVSVTGGKCSVGITIKDTLNSEYWFNAADFLFYQKLFTCIPTLLENNDDVFNVTPNPFVNETSINFKLSNSQKEVVVEIYNLKGIRIKRYVVTDVIQNQCYSLIFSVDSKNDTLYLARLITKNQMIPLKLIRNK